MPFEAWSVSSTFRFTSNDAQVLGGMAKRADIASIAIDNLTKRIGVSGRIMAEYEAMQERASRATLGMARSASYASDTIVGANRAAAASYNVVAVAAERARASTISYGRAMRGARASGAAAGASSGGMGAGGVAGIIALATSGLGVQQANSTQAALLRLSAQTGRSYSSLAAVYGPIAQAATNRTGISQTDTLNITSELAGVLKDPNDLRNAVVGTNGRGGIVDLVSVLQRNKVAVGSPETTARDIIRLDHVLNAYSGDAMARVNNSLYRSVVGSKMELAPVVTQAGYFGEQFRLASGNRPAAVDDIMKFAEIGYWGIGTGKWGSGFGQLLRTIGRPPAHSIPALEALHILDANGKISGTTMNANGEFTPLAMINEARRTIAMDPKLRAMGPMGIYGTLLNSGLPSNAARTMAEALSPKTTSFLKKLDASQATMPSLMQDETILMSGLGAQTDRLTGNFKNLANTLAGPLLKPLTGFVSSLATLIGNANAFFSQHPTAAGIGGATLGAAAIGGIGALLGGTIGRFGGFSLLGRVAEGVGAKGLVSRGGGFLGGMLSQHMDDLGFLGRGVGGVAGRIGSTAARSFPGLAMALEKVGGLARIGGIAMDLFGKTFGWALGSVFRLGTRFIPFVGEVMFAVDALKFFGKHAFDIGWAVGYSAAWIKDHGVPMIISGFQYLLEGILKLVVDTARGFFNGGHGGAWDVGRNLISGAGAGAAAEHGPGKVSKAAAHAHAVAHRERTRAMAIHRSIRQPRTDVRAYTGHTGAPSTYIAQLDIHPPTGTDFESIMDHLQRKVGRGDVPHSTANMPTNTADVTVAGHLFATG